MTVWEGTLSFSRALAYTGLQGQKLCLNYIIKLELREAKPRFFTVLGCFRRGSRMDLQKAGPETKWGHFPGPDRWHCVIGGTWSTHFPHLTGQTVPQTT